MSPRGCILHSFLEAGLCIIEKFDIAVAREWEFADRRILGSIGEFMIIYYFIARITLGDLCVTAFWLVVFASCYIFYSLVLLSVSICWRVVYCC